MVNQELGKTNVLDGSAEFQFTLLKSLLGSRGFLVLDCCIVNSMMHFISVTFCSLFVLQISRIPSLHIQNYFTFFSHTYVFYFPFFSPRIKKNQWCQLLLIHKVKITEGEWRGMYFLYVYFSRSYFKEEKKIIEMNVYHRIPIKLCLFNLCMFTCFRRLPYFSGFHKWINQWFT